MIYLYNYAAIIIYGLSIMLMKGKEQTKRSLFFICSTLHVTLFHALRDPFIFPDNQLYENSYFRVGSMTLLETITDISNLSTGVGFSVQIYFLNKISPDPTTLFVFTSVVMIAGLFWLFYKTSANPLMSVLIYLAYPLLFYHTLYVLRQGMATIFLLYSLYFLNKKYILSVVLALIGVAFHPTAIIFVPFLVFAKINLKKLPLPALIFLLLALAVIFRLSLAAVLSYMPRYEGYGDGKSVNNVVPFIVLSSLCVLHLMNMTLKKVNGVDKTYMYYLLYGLLVSIFTIGINGGGRLCSYFLYIIPFTFPMLYKYKSSRENLVFPGILYIILLIFISFHITGGMYEEYAIAARWKHLFM